MWPVKCKKWSARVIDDRKPKKDLPYLIVNTVAGFDNTSELNENRNIYSKKKGQLT